MNNEITKSSSSPAFSDQPPFTFTLLPSSSTIQLPYDTPTLLLFPIRPQNSDTNSELKTPNLNHDVTTPISLELSLSINHNPSKKRPSIANQNPHENKRMKFPLITNKANSHSLWRIKKILTKSDIGHLSRLIVASEDVENNIIPFWDAEGINNLRNGVAVKVRVWDYDTKTEHEMMFKRWISNGSFVFNNYWIKTFVKRRGLKQGDQIGLFWDQGNSRLNFTVLKRACST